MQRSIILLLPLMMFCVGSGCSRHGGRFLPPVPAYQPTGLQAAQPASPAPGGTPASTTTQSPAAATATAQDRTNAGGTNADLRDRELTQTLGSLNEILDAFFDYNAFQLRPDAVAAVTGAAGVLRGHMEADPKIRLVIEGHCDERGSAEFNLALGDRRAEAVRDLLGQLGLPAARMTTISYGEAKPACGEANENCWQRNRRAHIRHERE